jgi:hypothetical protein
MKTLPRWAIESADSGTRQGPLQSRRPSKKSGKKSSAKKKSGGKKR